MLGLCLVRIGYGCALLCFMEDSRAVNLVLVGCVGYQV